MPLRDHFRPPVEKKHSWDELHGGWPMMIVRQLFPILPEGYVAAPGVHLGTFEIDVSVYDADPAAARTEKANAGHGGVATLAPPTPTLTMETDWPDQDEYEVRVYDERHGCRLVAAIERSCTRRRVGLNGCAELRCSSIRRPFFNDDEDGPLVQALAATQG